MVQVNRLQFTLPSYHFFSLPFTLSCLTASSYNHNSVLLYVVFVVLPPSVQQFPIDLFCRSMSQIFNLPCLKHSLSSDVILMTFSALFSHDVAKCYGDQNGDGDSHSNAYPDDFFIDPTMIPTFEQRTCCINICLCCNSYPYKMLQCQIFGNYTSR